MSGRKKKPIVIVPDRDGLVLRAKQMLAEGYSRKHISKKLSEISTGIYTGTDFETIADEGFQLLRGEYSSEKIEIVTLHVKRYDSMVAKLMKVKDLDKSLIGKPIA